MKWLVLLSFFIFPWLAPAQKASDSTDDVVDSLSVTAFELDSMISYAENFIGCRYGYGSCGPKTFDCSGFVQHVYGKYGVQLPHTSGGIAEMCDEVKLKKVKPGDLLFFAGRKVSKKHIGHVSIVHSVEDDKITMIHATVQGGVMKEVLSDSEYFTKRFIRAGRLDKHVFSDKGK